MLNKFVILFSIIIGVSSIVLSILYYLQGGSIFETMIAICFSFSPFIIALIIMRKNNKDY